FGLRLHQTGYMHLLFTQEEMSFARRKQGLWRRLDVDVHILSPEEAKEALPGLNVEDVLGAMNCPRDGYTDPHLATVGFADLAKEEGASVHVGAGVVGLEMQGDRVTGVRTAAGTVATPLVVDAAGPWAAEVSRMAGVDVPVRPFRRHLWFTRSTPEVGEEAPILFDTYHDFYFRREGEGVLMCLGDPREGSSFITDVDWPFAEKVAEYATYRFPPFEDSQLVSAWAAPRDITPDHDAILGPVPGVEGLIVAAGHSGHGFMLSPAVGRMMADYIVDGHSEPDIAPLTFDRFAGREWPLESYAATGV
ncbi:MAG: FAD-binding oxidoreductase, partial [Dehalococcoidales bacterium]|nr:FAD-binding oxidoreductase [Dehalococcoidales bacterium]